MAEWDPKKMFESYLLEYMRAKGMHATAEIFTREANIGDRAEIKVPQGFLKDWWSTFYDAYMSKELKEREAKEESSKKDTTAITIDLEETSFPTMASPNVMLDYEPIGPRNSLVPNSEANGNKTDEQPGVSPSQNI